MSVRYTDEELWDTPKVRLDQFKNSYTMNQFCLWSINRLGALIKQSVDSVDWMKPDEVHLRTYRVKAQRFYEEKLVRG